ncbi:MAG: hypothetical protein QOG59_2426 [Solirubrobacteraceae bacterium]|jgi:hypothetical protein|nr:hypothetical protein [Solirubrobacteraceae bacterium]
MVVKARVEPQGSAADGVVRVVADVNVDALAGSEGGQAVDEVAGDPRETVAPSVEDSRPRGTLLRVGGRLVRPPE